MKTAPDSVFDHARAAFAAAGQTLPNVRRDFPEWHRGRPRYALWALDVDIPAVRHAVAAAETHLAGRLLAGYRRQPHVTLGLCGFPTDDTRGWCCCLTDATRSCWMAPAPPGNRQKKQAMT